MVLEESDFAIKEASRRKRGGKSDQGQKQVGLPSLDNFQLNKIAARWPARAVAQFYFTDK